ncbi:AbrB/MazE/SpoVT family DNA-binding domain-containing protein [Pararobbsia silviterrae]|nr:AbrB/MazE/SpoVT family DNA-binding domain-containing protein [Pararobbsia silviterrae]
MEKKGRIKLPKDMRKRLNLREGDRVLFYWSEDQARYVMIACNLDAATALEGREPIDTGCTFEETEALLKWHRGRKLTHAEMELVIGVIRAEADRPDDVDLSDDEAEVEGAADRTRGPS